MPVIKDATKFLQAWDALEYVLELPSPPATAEMIQDATKEAREAAETLRTALCEIVPQTRQPGTFCLDDEVRKIGGDYEFEGTVQGIIVKVSGEVRYAVEDDRGVLFIFNGKQVEPR